MHAIDVANQLLTAHGTSIPLTNRRINKLVYFTQVEALRRTGQPLFDDTIEADEYGPVIPAVRDAFSQYGTNQIAKPTAPPPDDATLADLAADVAVRYGHLTVYDLMRLSHREGGAWNLAYEPGKRRTITPQLILASSDMAGTDCDERTMAATLAFVNDTWPNTITLLERS